MSPLRMLGSTSGYAELAPSAVAGDQTFTLPGTGGTLDRLNRAGNVLQVVEASTTTQASTTANIPVDGTIPQNTEGTEILTCSIAPTSSSNKLLIEVVIPVWDGSTSISASAALFQDSTANALSAVIGANINAGYSETMMLSHYMTAGTTSSTTFKLRYGTGSGTMFINRRNDISNIFGGVIAARMVITEIAA